MLPLVGQRRPPAVAAAAGLLLRIGLLLLYCLAAEVAWADEGLLDTSGLEMFVDDLPEMPKIRGYDLRRDGTPVSKSLTIGMFEKTWVPRLLMKYPEPSLRDAVQRRYIVMYEYQSSTEEPTHLFINGKSYDDPATETPRAGTSEVWEVINLTEDNHPLHIHLGLLAAMEQRALVDVEVFKACMARRNDAEACDVRRHARGKPARVPFHERGWKNVFKVRPGHVTTLLVRFAPLRPRPVAYPFNATAEPGYVYHCHILDHEDNVMMRPLKIIN